MKVAFIHCHRSEWPISERCRVLQATMTAYHERFVRKAAGARRRQFSEDALWMRLKVIQAESYGAYGWPRTRRELLARAIRVGK